MKQDTQSPDRRDAVVAHVRIANPRATAEERRAAQQARVGILRNPAEPKLATPPPRDVWRKWPRLRSSRRPGAAPSGLQAQVDRGSSADSLGQGDERPRASSSTPDAQMLRSQSRALRQALQTRRTVDPGERDDPQTSGGIGSGDQDKATPEHPDTAATLRDDIMAILAESHLTAGDAPFDPASTAAAAAIVPDRGPAQRSDTEPTEEGAAPDMQTATPPGDSGTAAAAPHPTTPGPKPTALLQNRQADRHGAAPGTVEMTRGSEARKGAQQNVTAHRRVPVVNRVLFLLSWGIFCAVIGILLVRLIDPF